MTATSYDENVHEETPLLSKQKGREPTPLPKLQLSILMGLQFAEPMTSQCIYPFINQVCPVVFDGFCRLKASRS